VLKKKMSLTISRSSLWCCHRGGPAA